MGGQRTITSKVTEGESSLALHLQARAIHELHEARDQLVLGLRELLPVVRYANMSTCKTRNRVEMTVTVNGDIAKRSGAVVLHVRVRGVKQADKNGNCTGIDKLLPVFICSANEKEMNSNQISFNAHRNASCSGVHQSRCVGRACPSNVPAG